MEHILAESKNKIGEKKKVLTFLEFASWKEENGSGHRVGCGKYFRSGDQ